MPTGDGAAAPDGRADVESVTVELYVRGLLPDDGRDDQTELVDRATRLEARGAIDDVTVHDRGPSDDSFALERLEAFEAWADSNDMAVGSFFARDVAREPVTGDRRSIAVFPAVALAEWHGDELTFVAPCTDGATVYTVADRLDALADRAGSR